MRWRAGLCRIACLALAVWAVFCVDAEARTGKIVLAVTGDETMRDDLKQLVDEAAALDAIEAHPEADQVTLSLTVDTGPRFKVGSVAVRGAQAASLPAI